MLQKGPLVKSQDILCREFLPYTVLDVVEGHSDLSDRWEGQMETAGESCSPLD